MVFIRRLHPWQVSVEKAIEIQNRLQKKIKKGTVPFFKNVAGVDVGYSGNVLKAAVCVFNGLGLIEIRTATAKVYFPYIPGLLTFREGPAVLKVFKKLNNKPDVILFDGQGICHPRRMGIATHLGIILDIPSIGCAKSSLCGVWKMPGVSRGSFSFIYDRITREKLGAVLRTRADVRPIFVSPGYKISLKQSIELVLSLCPKYRIPEPLRWAHRYAKSV